MAIRVIGLDLAKNVFQVHGVDETGRRVLKRKLRRTEVLRLFSAGMLRGLKTTRIPERSRRRRKRQR